MTCRWTPERIIRLRGLLGISKRSLAKLLQVSTPSVMRWERGDFSPQARYQDRLDKLLRKLIRNPESVLKHVRRKANADYWDGWSD